MIITQSGIYAILSGNTFKEWRYLVEGTECNYALVLPQTTNPQPDYNLKTQKLIEQITIRESDALQSWEIQDLSTQEISNRKRPDGQGFQKEMITNPDLLAIYKKILTNYAVSGIWLNEVRAALVVYIPQGFASAINSLASSSDFMIEEIETVNTALYKYDLELITWSPE